MTKYILLSFGGEEFDAPLKYGEKIKPSVQFDVSLMGLRNILSLLEYLHIRATFFVTANFALHHPELIEAIARTHEIASQGFY
ncbi:Putative xylanase/chitin deacetylase (fragment) [Planktothrix serta PCC 8927]|uniref:Xylanase/chitin deacetylase n=1 Tax=Planktothrix serta PCC 8927 TaxID=671068 RepID=A0A7Z9E2U2_9CYAN